MKFTVLISSKPRPRVRLCRWRRCRKARAWKSMRSRWPATKVRQPRLQPILPANIDRGKVDILMSKELLALFRKTGALLDGHFVLRSGLHSREYFQCAILLQHTDIAERVCKMLADKLRSFDCDSVISPALGGIIVGQEVGRSLGKRHIFAEKDEGKLVLRRGFQILPNEKFVVVEDVVTRGGRVQETIDIVRAHGGVVSAVGVIVDRSGAAKPNFACPFISLVEMNVETFSADNLPLDLVRIPAVKPGSK